MTQEQKDTIREALEDWLNTPLSADEVAFSRSDGKVTTQVSVAFYAGYKAALDSLPVDKPVEAKPQKPSKDVKQIVDDIVYSLSENIGNQKVESITDLITAFADEIRREAVFEFATKIADWPMKYDGPSPYQGESESYYEITIYCYGLIGREWK